MSLFLICSFKLWANEMSVDVPGSHVLLLIKTKTKQANLPKQMKT